MPLDQQNHHEHYTPTASPVPDYAALFRLETEILAQPQVHMPIANEHCDGLLARSMFIPAGTIATGAVHRSEGFFLVRYGSLIIDTPDGPAVLPVGHMAITRVGCKRAVIALTDVVVTTFHPNPTNETDPDAIWDLFTIPAEQLAAPAASTLEHQL